MIQSRLLFHAEMKPGQTRVFRLDRSGRLSDAGPTAPVHGSLDRIASPSGANVRLSHPGSDGVMTLGGQSLPLPQLHLIEDPTDTWSHGIDRYASGPAIAPQWEPPLLLDDGPLMASLLQRGRLEQSRVQAEWRVYHNEPFVELLLRIEWVQRHQVLKLTWPLPTTLLGHDDGIPGGCLQRSTDGAERPLRDFTRLRLQDGTLGVVCPDIYALDATPLRVRFTLLRGALMAHHEPAPKNGSPRAPYADTGVHGFRFRFYSGDAAALENLEKQATLLQRSPIVADLTRGMLPA